MKTEKMSCPKCGKGFNVEYIKYPCDLEGKHDGYIDCPYCSHIVETIRLLGTEDVKTTIIEGEN